MTGSIVFGVMFTIIAIYEWIQVFEMNCSRVSVTHLPNKNAVYSEYPEIFGTYSQINGSKINFRNLYQSDFDDGKYRYIIDIHFKNFLKLVHHVFKVFGGLDILG